MYKNLPSFVLGFHGCDRTTGEKILSGEILQKFSENPYDWLGHGIYFWENDPIRAQQWAEVQVEKTRFKEAVIIGAVINPGQCLNLLQNDSLAILKSSYDYFITVYESLGYKILPENKTMSGGEKLLRNLDCAVIEVLHDIKSTLNEAPYDTVRGVFWEGGELYPNAGFSKKNHIQICVRNPNCIKGYFLPREKGVDHYPKTNSLDTFI